MKKLLTTLAIYGFTCLNFMANEVKKSFIIQKDGKSFEVTNLPVFTKSEPITNSFVYIDGEYVEPPYIISTSNLVVYINERIIRNFVPDVLLPAFYTKTRPELPKDLNEETSMYDERFNFYLWGTCYYLQEIEKLTAEETVDEMFRVIQLLPNIKNVERNIQEPARFAKFKITYQDGKTVSTGVLPLTGRQSPYKLDTVGIHIDKLCESFTNRLSQGFSIKIVQGEEIESKKLPNQE